MTPRLPKTVFLISLFILLALTSAGCNGLALPPGDGSVPVVATPEPTSIAGQPGVIMCTPPACAPGEVYACGEGDCIGGCGTICVTPTEEPVLMCTPPACAPGEVYACGEGDCPGGCGTICVPADQAGDQVGGGNPLGGQAGGGAPPDVPTDWEGLERWVTAQWQAGANPAAVRAALQSAGWQRDFNDWLSADFDGDLRDEWVMILTDDSLPSAPFGEPGNLWIVNGNGVIFRYYPVPSSDIYEFLAPEIVGLADMTGDTLPELVTNAEICGAHTCYGNFRVIGFAGDLYADAVDRPSLGEGDPTNTISLSYPTVQLQDLEQDGTTELLVNGGTIGSVGAGIVRPRTEIWAWDGTAVRLADTQLDPTDYRHHVLYEANDLLAEGDLDGALLLYEAAITDSTLRDDVSPSYSTETVYTAIAQFAAFRLAVVDLLQGDAERAGGRLEWLRATYPEAVVTEATAALLDNWTGPDGLAETCRVVEEVLATAAVPQSAIAPLADLGYGNPGLQAADLCP